MTLHDNSRPSDTTPLPLGQVAAEFGLSGATDSTAQFSGVVMSSGAVLPGDLFVAISGLRRHAANFLPDAVARGAAAVLTDGAGAEIAAELGSDLPVLIADNPRELAGKIAAKLYGQPASKLTSLAVTGSNGKTTTTYLIRAALEGAHPVSAILGTVELRIGDEGIESPRTTVEGPVLQAMLGLAVERGATAAVVEASSHGIALDRVSGLKVDVAVFTNLQRDHLDFHGDMEGYFRDKAKLFTTEHAKAAVVCVDDEWGQRLAAQTEVPVVRVRTLPGLAAADWYVESMNVGLDGVGSTFVLVDPDGTAHEAHAPLPGQVNVTNSANAIVAAVTAGVPLAGAISAVARAPGVPGRMERVVERTDRTPLFLVDYAHTPDALELALNSVRPITPGRLWIVFGSDGDRDQGKRPLLGEIAARLADVLVVTDENPRSEDPGTIRAQILEGVRQVRPKLAAVTEAETRQQAIHYALRSADPADTIIITGKGHEPTQEIAGVFHRYNDRDCALNAAAQIWGELADSRTERGNNQ